MKNNCYNCKYKLFVGRNPFAKTIYWCKVQHSWIYSPKNACPLFECKLFSKIFGDQSPLDPREPMVGGCAKEVKEG